MADEDDLDPIYLPAYSGFTLLNAVYMPDADACRFFAFPIIAWDVTNLWHSPHPITVAGIHEEIPGQNVYGVKCPDGTIYVSDQDPFLHHDDFLDYAKARLLRERAPA